MSLCVEFFPYLKTASRINITWPRNDRETWMYEFEVHGIYLGISINCIICFEVTYQSIDTPYYMMAPKNSHYNVSITNSVLVALPEICIQSYNINDTFITFNGIIIIYSETSIS